MCWHTAVATPSTLIVLPTNSSGRSITALIGVASFNVTPAPSVVSSAAVTPSATMAAAINSLIPIPPHACCCPDYHNVAVPILTIDDVSLAFGHLPLFEHADLRVDEGERIALIGRNGSGKSSLLRVVSGELVPDAGTIWRAPGSRTARLDQDVQGAGDRTVFDEVAAGLGELGALVGEYHRAAMAATQGV